MTADVQPTQRRLNRIETVLVARGVVSIEALDAAKARQRGAKRPLVEVLLEQEAVDEDELVAALAAVTGRSVLEASELLPDPGVQGLVPAETAQRLGLLPLREEDGELVVATGDPLQVLALDELAQQVGMPVRALFAKPSDVRRAMRSARAGEEALHDLLKNAAVIGDDVMLEADGDVDDSSVGSMELDQANDQDGPAVRLLNLVLADAIRHGASDVHIEPEKDALRIRFRIDGLLREVLAVPVSTASSVVSRLKIVAGLDIIETRMPQDGRAKVSCAGQAYDLRVSTLPCYFGEKAVIRILDATTATFDLNACGIDADVLAQWREMLHRPNGLVLMTGPTGSGKTSTLYASLLELRDPSRNIVTVEDPVEYQFPGIVHVPVRTKIGMTFAKALRSILRQDPDVVLVGEIRDAETANVCLQAAMTGHLVLSTLHTNDAVGAIPRLLDLGADPTLVAGCLLGVMAQRLARTLCADCATDHTYESAVLLPLGADFRGEPVLGRTAAGCPACRGTGYRGRTALVELVAVTPSMSALIASGAADGALLEQSRKDGTRLLVQSGLSKVAQGLTTPDEVLRVAAGEMRGAETGAATGAETDATATPTATVSQQRVPPSPEEVLRRSAAGLCANCQAERAADWSFCPHCGEAAPQQPVRPVAIVCDDDPVSRRTAARALEAEFPRVVEVDCGQAALDAIAIEVPDVLVVDQMMPGLTGVEVIQALRSDLVTAALPIVMLTGSRDEIMEEASLEAGADDYLQKPVPPARLRTRVRAILRARERLVGIG